MQAFFAMLPCIRGAYAMRLAPCRNHSLRRAFTGLARAALIT